jgi:hypothetical protein
MSKSLEALEELKDEIIPDFALDYEDQEDYNDWIEGLYQTIKQDLELLEILKKYLIEIQVGLRLADVLNVKGVQGIVLIKDFENKEDFNKIQEWLNNNE